MVKKYCNINKVQHDAQVNKLTELEQLYDELNKEQDLSFDNERQSEINRISCDISILRKQLTNQPVLETDSRYERTYHHKLNFM